MPQDFQPLFKYFDGKFSELKSDISRLEKKTDTLQTSVDGFAKSSKKTEDGLLVQTRRVDKLEEWAKPIGEKLKIPLIH